jgi:hypothetical protein
VLDLAETLRRFETLLARSTAEGAELAVFPWRSSADIRKAQPSGATVGER